jgi:hypothetical protein
VQGEGRFAGMPMQFVRFWGCNLDCSWCDQPSALNTRPQASRFYEQDNESIAELVTRHPLAVPACFTGGEPFRQAQHLWEIGEHIREMDQAENGNARLLTVETNGTFYEERFENRFYLSMSPKFEEHPDALLDLAEEKVAAPLHAHGEDSILNWLDGRIPMHLKFVVTGEKQFEGILAWLERVLPNRLRRGVIPLYFQPEWFSGKEVFRQIVRKWVECERWKQILNMGFEEVKFLPQCHKQIGVR